MTQIGFAGLGNMGGPMARNLAAKGYSVRVFDLVQATMEAAVAADPEHISAVSSAEAAAADADVFISMLPASRHVEGLYLGTPEQRGVLSVLRPGALAIDCSTIDAATSERIAKAAAEGSVHMIDAPVSGGVAGASNGTLTFIVGGTGEGFEAARPVLEAMGNNLYHAGANGAGQTAKICNNMLLSILMAGTAEALALGVKNGLDPVILSEIMKQSSGGNWALNVYNPFPGVMENAPAARNYSGGFLVDLMLKDLALAMGTAEQVGATVPLGALARQLYTLHKSERDAGELDFSSIQLLYGTK